MNVTPRRPAEGDESRRLTLHDVPFQRLLEEDTELLNLRREYQSAPQERRRLAALYEYHRGLATEMFDDAISRLPSGSGYPVAEPAGPCPGVVLALAIDPECAPALLTVGSVEYQLGRVAEAMQMFLTLPTLAPDKEDLPAIIDKAGDFLIDRNDMENAIALYTAAIDNHPAVPLYHNTLGYCAGKLGRREQAVEHFRRAVELEPRNHIFLNDMGWSLMDAGRYNEAEQALQKAVELAPDDDELARNNLDDLRRRRELTRQRKE